VTPTSADQANTLRLMRLEKSAHTNDAPGEQTSISGTTPTVIAIASGKGGVGKTSLVANLAVAFGEMGHRVLALDGDLGLANLDITFGTHAPLSLADLVDGTASVQDVLRPVANNVYLLPACSGRYDLANLASRERYELLSAIDGMDQHFDTVLIDTAAGIGSNSIGFAGAAERVLIVVNGEPTSLADAYAFIKVLATRCGVERVEVVSNMVRSTLEGEEVFKSLCRMAERFLGVGMDYMGCVMRDRMVSRSLFMGQPLLVVAPTCPASQSIRQLANRLSRQQRTARAASGGIQLFWRRLVASEASQ